MANKAAEPTSTAGELRSAGYAVPERFKDGDIVKGLSDAELSDSRAPARKVIAPDGTAEVHHVEMVHRFATGGHSEEYRNMTPRERAVHDSKGASASAPAKDEPNRESEPAPDAGSKGASASA